MQTIQSFGEQVIENLEKSGVFRRKHEAQLFTDKIVGLFWVEDGTRTHDPWNHNPML